MEKKKRSGIYPRSQEWQMMHIIPLKVTYQM